MTDPKLAIATDQGRYYRDPIDDALVPSVTNVLNDWSIPALAPGAAKLTAEYVLDHLPAAVRASRDPDERELFRREASKHYEGVWEKRRDLGSRVHALAEAHVLGKPMPADDEAAPFLEQYERFLDEFGVDVEDDIEAAEITVFRREEPRYAGTADLWPRLRFPSERSPQHKRWKGRTPADIATPSGLWVVDAKTSLTKPASQVYRDHVLQLAGLRFADVAVLPDGTEVPVPEFVGAAILNLRVDSYALVPLPADEAAHMAFLSLIGVALFGHQLDLKPCKPVAVPLRVVKNGVA